MFRQFDVNLLWHKIKVNSANGTVVESKHLRNITLHIDLSVVSCISHTWCDGILVQGLQTGA